MPKMHVSVDIDVEKLSRDDLNVLRSEIENEIALREVIKNDTSKFRFAYYARVLNRCGQFRTMMRYQDDMKCTLNDAKKYVNDFVRCQGCGKFGGYGRSVRLPDGFSGGWVCPHCGIPPLPEGGVEVEDDS